MPGIAGGMVQVIPLAHESFDSRRSCFLYRCFSLILEDIDE